MGNGKVLITGGCGFIGRHLAKKLVEMRKNVTILDATAPRDIGTNTRMMVKGDIRNEALVGRLMDGVETVYHLAAVTTFDECRSDPRKALDVNGYGTITVLQEAVRKGISNFVYFSSASVYSGNKEPVKHEKLTLNPKSIYGITKLMGESSCDNAIINHGLSCAVLRPFNVYGEGGRGVINRFTDAARTDWQVTIYGDGTQTRDYIHVEDVVRTAIAVGESKLSGVYNVGTGEGCNLLSVKGVVEHIGDVAFKVEWLPREPWDLQELVASTAKIKKILPKTMPLEEGLTALLAYSPR